MPAALAVRQMLRDGDAAARGLRFAAFFSGYLPQNLPAAHPYHELLASPPCGLPTLHVNGTQDAQVQPAINQDLETRFSSNRTHVDFYGGHDIPNLVKFKEAADGIREFVAKHVHT